MGCRAASSHLPMATLWSHLFFTHLFLFSVFFSFRDGAKSGQYEKRPPPTPLPWTREANCLTFNCRDPIGGWRSKWARPCSTLFFFFFCSFLSFCVSLVRHSISAFHTPDSVVRINARTSSQSPFWQFDPVKFTQDTTADGNEAVNGRITSL